MQICLKCRTNEATLHIVHKAGDREVANVHLCEDCARPVMRRQEASDQGATKCEFCGGVAFSPLPGLREITYACCACRGRYGQAFFEFCAAQRPDLLARSEGKISYFDWCFDNEIEQWADGVGTKVVQAMRESGQGNVREPKS